MKSLCYLYAMYLSLLASCGTQRSEPRQLYRMCETAAAFANYTCDSLYNAKPFVTEYHLTFRDSLLVWDQSGSINDNSYYANVTFTPSGDLVGVTVEARRILRGPVEELLRNLRL